MKNYKYICIIPLLLFVVMADSYGQKQSFTQYFLNLPSLNPAFTGYEPFLDIKSAYRQRWSNFTDENSSFYVGAYGAIGKTSPTVYRNNAPRISNPKLYGRMAGNSSLRRVHGIGGMLMSNRVGPFKSLTFEFNYAFHLPLSRKLSMSMGAKGSYTRYEMDFQELTVREHPDAFYAQLINLSGGEQQQVVGDFGITFYTEKFFIGFSSANLITKPLEDEELLKLTTDGSYEMIAGTQLALSRQLELYPGFRLKHSELYEMSWEANLRMRYNKMIYFGAAYENKIKAALLFGLTFDSRYNINYSYDYFLNELRDFNMGNHEFTLGLAIFNKYSREPRLW